MTLQDFRGQGPPADIGTYNMPCDVLVFHHTFSGVQYTCAVRSGSRGWVLVDYGLVDSTVIQSGINALAAGRTWQENVVVMGNFTITTTILLPSYTELEVIGKITLANGANCDMVHNSGFGASVNDSNKIKGGYWDGNKANQGAGPYHGIYLNNVGGSIGGDKCELVDLIFDNVKGNAYYLYRLNGLVARNLRCGSGCTGRSMHLEIVSDSRLSNIGLNSDLANFYMNYCNTNAIDDLYAGGASGEQGQIYIENSYGNQFSNVRIDYMYQHALWLEGSAGTNCWLNSFKNLTITDMRGTTNTYDAIHLASRNCRYNDFDVTIRGDVGGGNVFAYGINEVTSGAPLNDYNTFVLKNITGCTNVATLNGNGHSKLIALCLQNSGTSTGTGLQQTIPHLLGFTPNRIMFSDLELGANAYQSAAADAVNIYVTAVVNQDYTWRAWIE